MLLAGQEGKILLGDDGARPLEGIVAERFGCLSSDGSRFIDLIVPTDRR